MNSTINFPGTHQLFRILLFILSLLFGSSCAIFSKFSKDSPPSWVSGIRSGDESLKVTNGNKIYYRRILKASDDTDSQETCAKVLDLASKDIQNEFLYDGKIPYTLEYLHFDEEYEDCSVTLSISNHLSSRLSEIKKLKKNFEKRREELERSWKEAKAENEEIMRQKGDLENYIDQNRHLFDQYNLQLDAINRVSAMLKNRSQLAADAAMTGITKNEFDRLMKMKTNIFDSLYSVCFNKFQTTYYSIHGPLIVCWFGGYHSNASVKGICDAETEKCWRNNPG
jgi:hypothetical protein